MTGIKCEYATKLRTLRPQGRSTQQNNTSQSRGPKPRFFSDACFHFMNRETVGRTTLPQRATQRTNLRPVEACVASAAVQQAIKVHEVDGVEINQRESFDTDSGEGLRDNRSYAACADDPYAQSRQVVLGGLAPCRHSSAKFLLQRRRRH